MTDDHTGGTDPSAPQPQPYYPSLAEPLRLDIHQTTVTYDGRRVTIHRRDHGTETLPLHLLAAVLVQHVDEPPEGEPNDRLVLETTTGRTTSAGFHPGSHRQVVHFQDELSRAIAGHEPTGNRPPPPSRVGLIIFAGIVILIILMWLN